MYDERLAEQAKAETRRRKQQKEAETSAKESRCCHYCSCPHPRRYGFGSKRRSYNHLPVTVQGSQAAKKNVHIGAAIVVEADTRAPVQYWDTQQIFRVAEARNSADALALSVFMAGHPTDPIIGLIADFTGEKMNLKRGKLFFQLHFYAHTSSSIRS